MDRYFIRDILIFLTYAGAVWWGIMIERSTHEMGHAITRTNALCNSYTSGGLPAGEAVIHEGMGEPLFRAYAANAREDDASAGDL